MILALSHILAISWMELLTNDPTVTYFQCHKGSSWIVNFSFRILISSSLSHALRMFLNRWIQPAKNQSWSWLNGYSCCLCYLSVFTSTQRLSELVLKNCTWHLFHIIWVEQSYSKVIVTFWLSALKLWPSHWYFCSGYCSEAVNGNSFIFSGHNNGVCDLSTAGLFWPFDLCPWQCDY